MKNVILFASFIFALTSCSSDKLTEAKVKKLYSECFEKNGLRYLDNKISLGDNVSFDLRLDYSYGESYNKSNYLKLQEEGVINLEKIKNSSYEFMPKYKVSLTEKGEQYLTARNEGKWKENRVKCFSMKLDKVEEIHEIPANNIAAVRCSFKKVDETPFSILKDKEIYGEDKIQEVLKFVKTNNGWKLCD